VIDTPGIRSFGLAGITQSELAGWYPEMASLSGNCRYADCTHLNEPECLIRAAVEKGQVSQLRYKNYSTIREFLPVS
ncbi:MAG: ribosome small subunit-dependent GTPase A, partial [Anaerolineales bacterium]|nr:ribosome small subunit-dependent GTPase A [Candidatus Desulfolinea nitratireducens]